MEVVHAYLLGPVTITRDTIFHGTVTGDVTVLGGVHLDLLGTVLGNLLVEDSGTVCVRGDQSRRRSRDLRQRRLDYGRGSDANSPWLNGRELA